jgi:hypothetical protein
MNHILIKRQQKKLQRKRAEADAAPRGIPIYFALEAIPAADEEEIIMAVGKINKREKYRKSNKGK